MIKKKKSLAFPNTFYLKQYHVVLGCACLQLRENNAGVKRENEDLLRDAGRLRCAQPSKPHGEQEELFPHVSIRNPVTI